MKTPSPTGQRIEAARKLGGISPEKLGVLAGMSHGVVRMIETGARQDPASPTLGKLARVLGVTVDWLMSGGGEQPTKESVRAALAAVAPSLVEDDEPEPPADPTDEAPASTPHPSDAPSTAEKSA